MMKKVWPMLVLSEICIGHHYTSPKVQACMLPPVRPGIVKGLNKYITLYDGYGLLTASWSPLWLCLWWLIEPAHMRRNALFIYLMLRYKRLKFGSTFFSTFRRSIYIDFFGHRIWETLMGSNWSPVIKGECWLSSPESRGKIPSYINN